MFNNYGIEVWSGTEDQIAESYYDLWLDFVNKANTQINQNYILNTSYHEALTHEI